MVHRWVFRRKEFFFAVMILNFNLIMVGQHFYWILLDKKMRRFKVLTWGLIADGSTDLGDFEPFVSSNLFLTAA